MPLAKLAYDKGVQQYGLLSLPTGKGPFPVVVIVHGGCWVSTIGDINNSLALADALSKEGFAIWNIEYRSVNQEGGGFPGTFLDVAHAMDYLKQIAGKYNLDLKRMVVIGHSSGGQLALWLGARGKLKQDSSLYSVNPLIPNAVISLGGVPDLEVARVPAEKICKGDVIGKLLGEYEKNIPPKRFQETSAYEMLPIAVPQVLLIAERDEIVPFAIAERYLKKAKETHDQVTLVKVPYAGHMDLIVPNSVSWPYLLTQIHNFISNTPSN
ncbi:MAG: hypothetical protein A3F18_00705 [Legionellales bacterium RIFCSPHIGHO2_12_FULL_37_14]|nr:MAG: hypothetical protein A3F18_00705 [Legionellales bacterium RIFCSPHIGHO2_12_FULL_37_14]